MKPANGGKDTDFITALRPGRRGMGWWFLNNYIIGWKMKNQTMFDWTIHNIEESGLSEKIIPKLKALREDQMIPLQHVQHRRVVMYESPAKAST